MGIRSAFGGMNEGTANMSQTPDDPYGADDGTEQRD